MKCSPQMIVCLMLILCSLAFGQKTLHGAVNQQRNPDGFVDFALKQLNAQDVDYGCRIDEVRKLAVALTVKSIDSWAELTTLAFLTLSFLVIFHQSRERHRRELIAAQFLAQYHNAWVDAATLAAEVSQRYSDLVRIVNSNESSSRPNIQGAQLLEPKANFSDATKSQAGPTFPVSVNTNDGGGKFTSRDAGQKIKTPVKQSHEPEVDLMAQLRTLQQQLNAAHERERNLQQELTKMQHRVKPPQIKDENDAS